MRSTLLVSLATLFAATSPALARTYNIRNLCPTPINVYNNGKLLQSNLTRFISVNLTDDEGFFYTDANRKSNSNGTRVKFMLEKPYGYYYMVVDRNNFNVAMSVEPEEPRAPSLDGGRCYGQGCYSPKCTNAFKEEPKNLTSYPTDRAPPQPLNSCLDENTPYGITFCPDEKWPGPSSFSIHPNGNPNYCLDVQGGKLENGTPVQLYACNGTPAQKWDFQYGTSTKVQLEGTNFCLDAGSNPGNGVGMKIWQCYDNLPAQAWYYTLDNRIALEGKGQCLDLADGKLGNSSKVQSWQCTDNKKNQVWTWGPAL